MQPAIPNAQHQRRRAGFTIVELLVVILIIAAMIAISVAVLGDSVTEARIQATRSTIRQLDSMLQTRVETFGRLNLGPQAQQFKFLYDNASPTNSPPAVSLKVAEIIVRKDRYRGAFPQREVDLWGLDGVPNTVDDAPLWAIWNGRLSINNPSTGNPYRNDHNPLTESSELLYLALTEGTVFGGPSLGIDRIPAEHVQDTDGDSMLEFVDEWGQPLRFYNWPTRLIRPGGETSSPPSTPVTFAGIGVAYYTVTAGALMPGIPDTATDLNFDNYAHPLNQDPDDPTGALVAAQNFSGIARDPFNLGMLSNQAQPVTEDFYGTLDTYYTPLIVSGGPDESLGLNEPTTPGPERLAQPLATGIGDTANLDLLYDNITNRQR